VRDFLTPFTSSYGSNIVVPEIVAALFKLEPSLINMIQSLLQYSGKPHEDPHNQLRRFALITNIVCMNNVAQEAIRLSLFPFSIIGAIA